MKATVAVSVSVLGDDALVPACAAQVGRATSPNGRFEPIIGKCGRPALYGGFDPNGRWWCGRHIASALLEHARTCAGCHGHGWLVCDGVQPGDPPGGPDTHLERCLACCRYSTDAEAEAAFIRERVLK